MKRELNFFEDTILADPNTMRCCLHDNPVSFDWCEANCPRQSSCDTFAWAGDEAKLLTHEAWLCPKCDSIICLDEDECDCGFVKVSLRTVSGTDWSYKVGEQEKVKLWMRVGMTLKLTHDEVKKILSGDLEAFKAVLANRDAWEFDGEAYVPECDEVDALCKYLGLSPSDVKDMHL